ncbi:MAG TPA: hypothetical protein VG940_10485, partial [Gemmatimonadales bacterium]|nr:hypothetical protein [Gemmatimonadales bacterium]
MHPQGRTRALWIGTTFLGGLERRVTLIEQDLGQGGVARLVTVIRGRLVMDCHVRLLYNTDSLVVLDLYHDDTEGRGPRITIWTDAGRRGAPVVLVQEQFVSVSWQRGADRLLAWVNSPLGSLAVAGVRTSVRKLSLDSTLPSTSVALMDLFSPDTARQDIYPPLSLPGSPEVVWSIDRLGRVAGSDTQWTQVPPPSDSLKRVAWTRSWGYTEYDLENLLSVPIRDGDRVFAGIVFGVGEGMNGVGGLVEYSARAGRMR